MCGYMYILECSDGSFYVGSTKYLKFRLKQHQNGKGANHTKKRLPVKLVYFEEFQRIDFAFNREKQVQGWSRKKKEALIYGEFWRLPALAKSRWLRQAQSPKDIQVLLGKQKSPSVVQASLEKKKPFVEDQASGEGEKSSLYVQVPEPVEGTWILSDTRSRH